MDNTGTETYLGPTTFTWKGLEGYIDGGRFVPIISGGDGTDEGNNSGDGGATEGGNSGGTETGNSGEGPKFTQEQVDALIAREKDKATRGKVDPKELGFNSRKELDDFVKAQKDAEDKAKDQAQKDQDAAVEAAVKAAEGGILSKANSRVVRAEFILAATRHKVNPDLVEDALTLARANDELWDGVEVDDKGVVTGLNEAFFEELKKSKPFLFAETSQEGKEEGEGGGDIGAGSGGSRKPPAEGTKDEQLKESYPALRSILG